MTSESYTEKDIILDEAQIIQTAWSSYIANYKKGWSFESTLSHAKADARNKAIHQLWKKQAEENRKAQIESENQKFKDSGMDLHTYTMNRHYGRGSNVYYGD